MKVYAVAMSADALYETVECPTCFAGKGEHCVAMKGKNVGKNNGRAHTARQKAWAQVWVDTHPIGENQ